ncbi:hypothetical protein AG1IA_02178 [Rhizoctonia solani AG-1 IA]|uniref:Uncharacterized protein n=1 Tax=Thanatephorus cucumeris (strain AG1-IA) TaxID=983506 RepID=L8X3W9_THACA|nr:hypothetical protein AG1IA_02178 [Rhizoctonia solani AG-1 IA]
MRASSLVRRHLQAQSHTTVCVERVPVDGRKTASRILRRWAIKVRPLGRVLRGKALQTLDVGIPSMDLVIGLRMEKHRERPVVRYSSYPLSVHVALSHNRVHLVEARVDFCAQTTGRVQTRVAPAPALGSVQLGRRRPIEGAHPHLDRGAIYHPHPHRRILRKPVLAAQRRIHPHPYRCSRCHRSCPGVMMELRVRSRVVQLLSRALQ